MKKLMQIYAYSDIYTYSFIHIYILTVTAFYPLLSAEYTAQMDIPTLNKTNHVIKLPSHFVVLLSYVVQNIVRRSSESGEWKKMFTCINVDVKIFKNQHGYIQNNGTNRTVVFASKLQK